MTKEASTQPPYMSFGVFKNTVQTLAESTTPTGPLDRRVLGSLSGADYGALMSGLRFLTLIDDNRVATGNFRGLVGLSTDAAKFNAALLTVINSAYKPIIGKVSLKSGTIAELERAFKDAGVASGQMLNKSVRFYVKALQECGEELSPHITKPKPRAPRTATRKNGTATRATKEAPIGTDSGAPTEGTARMPIPGIQGGFIQYPVELTEAHCTLLDAMVGMLRAYAKGRAGGKDKPR